MEGSQPVSDFHYRVFISYAHRDDAWAVWLHKSLETWRVPSRLVGTVTAHGTIPRRLHPVFRDRDELASSDSLADKVNEALARSENLIVICSPAAAASRWVNEEVLAYRRLGRGERIFCLIVDGEPNATDIPGRASEECFCPALRFELDANGQPTNERTEPIAADARTGKDGKTNAKLKLIAGILDVGFDVLKQREQRRQIRRMAIVAALAVAVMAVTSVLAVFAVIARHDAERRQKQAEGLVGFMLGDLGDKLDQVHRLDIMQAVDDKAMAYFNSLPAADASDAALALRVTALQRIGGVRLDQGKTPAALESYQAAAALAAELVRREPTNMDRQATYGNSRKWVGQAHLYQGDLTQALQDFQAANVALKQAVAAKPDDGELAFNLAAAYHDSGYVLDHRGEFSAAKTQYEAALAIYTHWRAREPEQTRWQSYLGNEFDSLGKLALEQGRLDQAIFAYRANEKIKARLAAREPGDHHAQESLLISDAILGRTLAVCDDLDGAIRYTRAAVDSANTLMKFDTSESSWADYFGLYSQQLGGLLRQTNQLDAAAAADADAVRVLSALTTKDPASSDWPPDLAQAQLETARLNLARGHVDVAESAVDTATSIVQKLRAKTPDDRSLILLQAHAATLQGRIAEQRDNLETARHEWMQASVLLTPALSAGDDPNFLAAYAEVLLDLDQPKAATPMIDKLGTMGYRTPDFTEMLSAKKIAYTVNVETAQRIAVAIKNDATQQ